MLILRVGIAILAMGGASVASAEPTNDRGANGPRLASARLVEAELDRRVDGLDRYLAALEGPTRTYYFAWLATLSGLALGQAGLAWLVDDEAQRTGFLVNSGLALGGVGIVLLTPRPALDASRRFRQLPGTTSAEKRRKVEHGEDWLETQAASDRLGTSWIAHAGSLVVSGGAGLAVALAYEDQPLVGVRVGAGVLVASQLQIWTRPRRAIRYLARYRRSPSAPAELSFVPWSERGLHGLRLVGQF